jgi:hypothetical protein
MRFSTFTTFNSVISNASDLRLHSHHIVGSPMGNRLPMTRRDGASELPNLNECFEQTQGGQPRTPQARGPAVTEFKKGSPTDLQRRGVTGF